MTGGCCGETNVLDIAKTFQRTEEGKELYTGLLALRFCSEHAVLFTLSRISPAIPPSPSPSTCQLMVLFRRLINTSHPQTLQYAHCYLELNIFCFFVIGEGLEFPC